MLEAPVFMWTIALVLISLFVPTMLILFILRLILNSGKKTIKSVRW